MKLRIEVGFDGELNPSGDSIVVSEKSSIEITSEPDRLVIFTLLSVPREKWPFQVAVEEQFIDGIPVFPFKTQPNALKQSDIEPFLINLEAYLSLFGLRKLHIREANWEWIEEEGDHLDSGIIRSFKLTSVSSEYPAYAMSTSELTRCAAAASNSDKDSATLSLFRLGRVSHEEGKYIDAFRYFYLALENEFDIPQRKDGAIKKIKSDSRFEQHLKSLIGDLNDKSGLRALASIDLNSVHLGLEVFKWLFDLRGRLSHASSKTMKEWHPSKQHDYEDASLFALNLLDRICWENFGNIGKQKV